MNPYCEPGDWVVIECDHLICRQVVQRIRQHPNGRWYLNGLALNPPWQPFQGLRILEVLK